MNSLYTFMLIMVFMFIWMFLLLRAVYFCFVIKKDPIKIFKPVVKLSREKRRLLRRFFPDLDKPTQKMNEKFNTMS